MSALSDSWRISNRINLYVLDALDEGVVLAAPLKGRSIGEMFSHVHNVRLDWLKSGDPSLVDALAKIEKADLARDTIREALHASGEAIAALIDGGEESGRIKGFKPHVTAFVAYMCAHDAYHRAEVSSLATQLGKPLDKKTSFGMWEWGVR
jgi:uncharacterized damage-inducible protein DinB